MEQNRCRVCDGPMTAYDLQGLLTLICSLNCAEKLDPATMQEEWDYMHLAYQRLEKHGKS